MNFRYREEKQRKDELEQAQKASAQKEQREREDKAYEGASKLKSENTGDNRLNVSMQKAVGELADEYASLASKSYLTPEEKSRLNSIPKMVDTFKFAAQNMKSFVDKSTEMVRNGEVNQELLENGQDILGSIYNLQRGQVILDKQNGGALLELVDPNDPNKRITEKIDNFGDTNYLFSKLPVKQNILGKEGLVEQVSKITEPVKTVDSSGAYVVTKNEITPQQKEAAMLTMESLLSNDMKIRDAAQQLKLNYKFKSDDVEEKERVKQQIKDAIYNQAVSSKKQGTEKDLNIPLANLNLSKQRLAHDISQDAKKKEETPAPYRKINVQEVTSGTNYNTVPVRKGDRTSDVNQPPKAPTTVMGTVLRKTKDGKKEIVVTVKQKPIGGRLTPEAEGRLKNIEGYEVTDDDYEQKGEGKIVKYSSINDPQMVNDIIRTSLLDEEGNAFSGIQDYAKRNFGKSIEQGKATAQPKQKTGSYDDIQ